MKTEGKVTPLSEALQRFNAHFKQPVAGRSLFELSTPALIKEIDASIEANQISEKLQGADSSLTERLEPSE